MGLKRFIRKVAGPVLGKIAPFIGPLVGAATALKGGKIANRNNTAAATQEYERQKEFAQMGVRWKVEDAKSAGLHPLFALGAQTASYSPVAVQDSAGAAMAEAGQNISRAITAAGTFSEREMARLALRQAQNAITEGDLRNEQLRLQNRQLENDLLLAPITMPTFSEPEINFGGGEVDAARRQTATQYQTVPGDSSLAAGATPLWREFSIGNGRSMVLPGGMSGDAAEVLESLADSPAMMLSVLEENRQRYGKEFSDWMYRRYFETPLRRTARVYKEHLGTIGSYWKDKYRDSIKGNSKYREQRARARPGSTGRW